ncbi:hypothetical protein GCM10023310_69580 [Paenibacillus vulneris]|uniref:Uncharacterized protein n=1 Tax=Paenibacillus vulneris TaxID=1133364 RepID=A0ABW3UH07_9BACL
MKLTVIHNNMDDCLLYVNGEAYSDIDYRDAMCIQWLKDIVKEKVEIEFKHVSLERQYYPDYDLKVGDKVYFKTDKRPYTVKACNELFVICTKPFNLQHTCIYTIIDWKKGKRNRNNMVFNPYDYTKQSDIDECLQDLSDPNHVCEISHRGAVNIDIVRVLTP